ncbi:MAG: glutathione S-transferase [Hyphomicrobiales bacterium]|nr:glutathione S-transferase [Hyphomicrobiales bacterium]
MLLYTTARAPNPRRVEIFLREKGLSVPSKHVDIGKLEHRTESYAKVNPVQQMPSLELDDGSVLTESIAICRYFEELHPEPALFGTSARERAEVEMWQRRLEMGLLLTVASVFRHSHPFMARVEVPQVPEWAAANRPKVESFLHLFNEALAERPFVAGKAFSVADITGIVAVEFMWPARITLDPGLTHVHRWFADMGKRPSVIENPPPPSA